MMPTLAAPTHLHRVVPRPPAGSLSHRAGDLARAVPALTPANTNREVIQHFGDHPEQASLPVLEEGRPIGLINRSIFLTGFSLPFRREVYERKSCIAFMDKQPLVVDQDLPLSDLGRLAVEAGGKVLQDGFIVTRNGRYAGLGSGIDLLRALGDLEAARNRIIRESIDYAQIIQGALLGTSRRELEAAGIRDQHLLWAPREAVGGDAYFARRITRDGREGLFLALMDCTGHGVPGAFTAMLMTSFFGHAVDVTPPWEPGRVLAEVNRRVKENLGQTCRADQQSSFEQVDQGATADEGMDATCLWLERATGSLVFSGARHSLWVFAPGAREPEEVKGDREGVGYVETADDQAWASRAVPLPADAIVLATTDGILDQIGGPRRISFGRKRLWQAFGEEAGQPLRRRLEHCLAAMESYQGAEERRDDVSLFALQI